MKEEKMGNSSNNNIFSMETQRVSLNGFFWGKHHLAPAVSKQAVNGEIRWYVVKMGGSWSKWVSG